MCAADSEPSRTDPANSDTANERYFERPNLKCESGYGSANSREAVSEGLSSHARQTRRNHAKETKRERDKTRSQKRRRDRSAAKGSCELSTGKRRREWAATTELTAKKITAIDKFGENSSQTSNSREQMRDSLIELHR